MSTKSKWRHSGLVENSLASPAEFPRQPARGLRTDGNRAAMWAHFGQVSKGHLYLSKMYLSKSRHGENHCVVIDRDSLFGRPTKSSDGGACKKAL
jgi:hypothetical protein